MKIGDRVQGIYRGLPYVGRIIGMNDHSLIDSCVVTVQLEKSLVVDCTTLNLVHEQYENLELVC